MLQRCDSLIHITTAPAHSKTAVQQLHTQLLDNLHTSAERNTVSNVTGNGAGSTKLPGIKTHKGTEEPLRLLPPLPLPMAGTELRCWVAIGSKT